MSHSPGPWSVAPHAEGGYLVLDVFGQEIARVRSEANAQLMGAAPELLTRLVSVQQSLQQFVAVVRQKADA